MRWTNGVPSMASSPGDWYEARRLEAERLEAELTGARISCMTSWAKGVPTTCPRCREPLEHDRGHANVFCLTCDRWLHADCLHAHAAGEMRAVDGDWEHG